MLTDTGWTIAEAKTTFDNITVGLQQKLVQNGFKFSQTCSWLILGGCLNLGSSQVTHYNLLKF